MIFETILESMQSVFVHWFIKLISISFHFLIRYIILMTTNQLFTKHCHLQYHYNHCQDYQHRLFFHFLLLPVALTLCRGCSTVYPKKYAHGFCFAVLCCGNTLTDFPISIRLTSLALWQSNDCPSASKATLMYVDKYFMWIHYEWLHNHNKAKHNKTVCIFLGIYCIASQPHTDRITTG